jgi:hypothetical protein
VRSETTFNDPFALSPLSSGTIGAAHSQHTVPAALDLDFRSQLGLALSADPRRPVLLTSIKSAVAAKQPKPRIDATGQLLRKSDG